MTFTFKRYEKKFLLSAGKYAELRKRLDEHIVPDEYFQSTVCSIYYDNENFSLIRNSIEKPVFKEKLRLRSYNVPDADSKVFVELKKKYKGIVYKRRAGMTLDKATAWLSGEAPPPKDSQITREISWFLSQDSYTPAVFIACDRSAYVAKDNPELRITFDENMRWRDYDLDLRAGDHGELIAAPGEVLMEIKIPGTAPLWLARMLSELEIFPKSFSKYGTCYRNNLIRKYFFDSFDPPDPDAYGDYEECPFPPRY